MNGHQRIWFDTKRQHFFSIPKPSQIQSGDTLLVNLAGMTARADIEALEPFRITQEEATQRFGTSIDDAWVGLKESLEAMVDFGKTAADKVGIRVISTQEAKLPDAVESILGMNPGDIIARPGAIREKIQSLFGHINDEPHADTRQPPHSQPHTSVDPQDDEATENRGVEADGGHQINNEDNARESTGQDWAREAGKTVRDFLDLPEVNKTLSGVGKALSGLGGHLQRAASGDENTDLSEP